MKKLTKILFTAGISIVFLYTICCSKKTHQTQNKPNKTQISYTYNPFLTPYTKNNYFIKYPDLQEEIDTIYATHEYIDSVKYNHVAGMYISSKNKIIIKHYIPSDTCQDVITFCNYWNQCRPITYRHEREHARKMQLVHTENMYLTPIVQARIAVMNEMVAISAEIIEVIDHKYKTGKKYPLLKPVLRNAERKITNIAAQNNLTEPIDFTTPEIADMVIRTASQHFASKVHLGTYTKYIKQRYFGAKQNPAIPNSTSIAINPLLYNPAKNVWNQLWTLESEHGPCDIYGAASPQAKQDLLNLVDTVIYQAINDTNIRVKARDGVLR